MTGDDELWQGYDELGLPTQTPVTKPNARNKGDLHGASHVWVWRESTHGVELLLQRRAADKPTWPGYYDISAAGHIDLGETPLETALRETEEEIGLKVATESLKSIGAYRINYVDETSGFQENEFQFIYLYQMADTDELIFNDGEVDDVWWVGLDDFRKLIKDRDQNKKVVPHGDGYYTMLLEKVSEASSRDRE